MPGSAVQFKIDLPNVPKLIYIYMCSAFFSNIPEQHIQSWTNFELKTYKRTRSGRVRTMFLNCTADHIMSVRMSDLKKNSNRCNIINQSKKDLIHKKCITNGDSASYHNNTLNNNYFKRIQTYWFQIEKPC